MPATPTTTTITTDLAGLLTTYLVTNGTSGIVVIKPYRTFLQNSTNYATLTLAAHITNEDHRELQYLLMAFFRHDGSEAGRSTAETACQTVTDDWTTLLRDIEDDRSGTLPSSILTIYQHTRGSAPTSPPNQADLRAITIPMTVVARA